MRRNDMVFVKLFILGGIIGYLAVGYARAQDPSGFTEQLNGYRAQRGLGPVAYDGASVGIAQTNNAGIHVGRGPHSYTGGLAQCSAWGGCAANAAASLDAWLRSPAHATIILSPALTAVGYASDGWAASVACQMGYAQAVQQQPAYYQLRGRRGLFRRWQ